jgi:hypothetical protein
MKIIDVNNYEEQDNYPGGTNQNDWDDTETGEDATNQDEDEQDDDEVGDDAANQTIIRKPTLLMMTMRT